MIGRSIWGQAKKEFGKIDDQKIKDQMVKDFVNFYGQNIIKESTLINGVKEFLKWCKEKEISMAVCTNKQEHLAIDLLKKIGIYDYFEYVAGSDTFDYCKPDPLSALAEPFPQRLLLASGATSRPLACTVIRCYNQIDVSTTPQQQLSCFDAGTYPAQSTKKSNEQKTSFSFSVFSVSFVATSNSAPFATASRSARSPSSAKRNATAAPCENPITPTNGPCVFQSVRNELREVSHP